MTEVMTKELLERRFRVLGKHSPLFYEQPLHLVRGEGVWVYDADGRQYLDVYNNVPMWATVTRTWWRPLRSR